MPVCFQPIMDSWEFLIWCAAQESTVRYQSCSLSFLDLESLSVFGVRVRVCITDIANLMCGILAVVSDGSSFAQLWILPRSVLESVWLSIWRLTWLHAALDAGIIATLWRSSREVTLAGFQLTRWRWLSACLWFLDWQRLWLIVTNFLIAWLNAACNNMCCTVNDHDHACSCSGFDVHATLSIPMFI